MFCEEQKKKDSDVRKTPIGKDSHQEVFKAFSAAVVAVKFKEVMKDTAYLLPPKQRAIARFINLAHTLGNKNECRVTQIDAQRARGF